MKLLNTLIIPILALMPPFCVLLGILIGFRRRIEFHYPVAVAFALFLAAYMGSFEAGPFDIKLLAMLAVFAAALGFLKPRESFHWAFFFAAFLALVEFMFLLTAEQYKFTPALSPLKGAASYNPGDFNPIYYFRPEFANAAAVRFVVSLVAAAAASVIGIFASRNWVRINVAFFDPTSGNKPDSDVLYSAAHTPLCIRKNTMRYLYVALIVIFYPVAGLCFYIFTSYYSPLRYSIPMANVLMMLFASFFLGALVAYVSRPRNWQVALFGFYLFFAILIALFYAYVSMLGDSYLISASGEAVRDFNIEYFFALLPAMAVMTLCMLAGIFAGFKWQFAPRVPIAVILGLSLHALAPGLFDSFYAFEYLIAISIVAMTYGWLNAREIGRWTIFFSLIITALRHNYIVAGINRIVKDNVMYPEDFRMLYPDIAKKYPVGIDMNDFALMENTLWFFLVTIALMIAFGCAGAFVRIKMESKQ